MGRQLAIGDVHGCYAELRILIEEVLQTTIEDEIYLLGF